MGNSFWLTKLWKKDLWARQDSNLKKSVIIPNLSSFLYNGFLIV